MPEQFTLKSAFREASGIYGDQRFFGAQGNGMQHLRHNFFARAVLSGDKNVGVGRTDL